MSLAMSSGSNGSAPATAPKVERKTRVYEVSSLDTIHSIALKFDMKTSELLRLNGLPSSYRIYSGQHLTVFENTRANAPEVTRISEDRVLERSSEMGKSLTDLTGPLPGSDFNSADSKSQALKRDSSAANFNFPTVITPSYRSVPLLVLLRQARDKKYFGDVQHSSSQSSRSSSLSSSLSAALNRKPSTAYLSGGFNYIPDEMRLSSKDVIKEQVRYYINEQRNVVGELTLMPSTIIFEPALDDPVTRELGVLNCQFQCDLKDVLDVHVIEAAEVLAWWKSRLPTEPKYPSTMKRPRTGSMSHGPSAAHLNTGSGSPGASSGLQIDSMLDKFDEGSDRGPRFLQLTVLHGKASEGAQTGKINYFLINRQSVELFFQKLQLWCAQTQPALASRRTPATNILAQKSTHASYLDSGKDKPQHTSAIPNDNMISSKGATSSPRHEATKSPEELIDLPKLSQNSALLTNESVLRKLTHALPARFRNSDWTLLYSTERHGVSLQTFYNKTKRKGPTYLLIEDDAGFMFGAYISESWEPQRSYYGTGECFLFTLYPTFNIYQWSGLNEFFIYSREDTIAVGGGSGKFALWLDQDLLQGSSAPCDTFLNSTLSCQEDFRCTVVEVWGFNDAMQ